MKTRQVACLAMALLLIGQIVVLANAETPIETVKEPTAISSFLGWLKFYTNAPLFSIVGVNRVCGISPGGTPKKSSQQLKITGYSSPYAVTYASQKGDTSSYYWEVGSDGTANLNSAFITSVCGSSNALIDYFQNWVGQVEGKNTLYFHCPTGKSCQVQVYCCPKAECTSSNDCSGATCNTVNCPKNGLYYACPGEQNILYAYSQYKYCSSSSTVPCWYKDNGVCYSYSYSGITSCSQITSGYYGRPLYSTEALCKGTLSTCQIDDECASGMCFNKACCVPKTCVQLGKTCGIWDNGCGKGTECGSCQSGYMCSHGTSCIEGCGSDSDCSGGKKCIGGGTSGGGACLCKQDYEAKCDGNKAYWYNSCGVKGSLKQDCSLLYVSTACKDGSCALPGGDVCGDSIVSGIEECDLGNQNGVSGSGCSGACMLVESGGGTINCITNGQPCSTGTNAECCSNNCNSDSICEAESGCIADCINKCGGILDGCGGTCDAACEPTCFDNQKNQGETGIDCGGPCIACLDCISPKIAVGNECKNLDEVCVSQGGTKSSAECQTPTPKTTNKAIPMTETAFNDATKELIVRAMCRIPSDCSKLTSDIVADESVNVEDYNWTITCKSGTSILETNKVGYATYLEQEANKGGWFDSWSGFWSKLFKTTTSADYNKMCENPKAVGAISKATSWLFGETGKSDKQKCEDMLGNMPSGTCRATIKTSLSVGICLQSANSWLSPYTSTNDCQTNTIAFIILIIAGFILVKAIIGGNKK